jgi:hypothetical protein
MEKTTKKQMSIGDPLNNSEPDESYKEEYVFLQYTIKDQIIQISVEQFKEKTGLVLQSLLLIHENLEGYESTPEHVSSIYYGVWAVLWRNPDLIEPEEIMEKWMEDFIDGYKDSKEV